MSWRTVVVSTRCKLDLKMGYLVMRGEETKRIFLDEIAILMIENPAISITGCLIDALNERKIRVIFCNSRHLPTAELTPCYGSHDCVKKLRNQIAWPNELKLRIWHQILSDKIRQQALFLQDTNHPDEAAQLRELQTQLLPMDPTNREGYAARIYFCTMFGADFTRQDGSAINSALNYGYSILLSAVSREICACGYLTQLGLFHDNGYNPYNLSSDLMEPFRVLIDRTVYAMQPDVFEQSEKKTVLETLNLYVHIRNSRQTVLNALKIYVHSVFDALENGDPMLLRCYSYEEER